MNEVGLCAFWKNMGGCLSRTVSTPILVPHICWKVFGHVHSPLGPFGLEWGSGPQESL